MKKLLIMFLLVYLFCSFKSVYSAEEVIRPKFNGLFNYGLVKREKEFPERIGKILDEIDEKSEHLVEILDNNYRHVPKSSDVVSIAFTDFYNQMIFRKALTELHRLFEVCSTCEDFIYYNNRICFLEFYIEDTELKERYYKLLKYDLDKFFKYLDENAINGLEEQEALFKREVFQDLAILHSSAEALFIDMRDFYKNFLLVITEEEKNGD